MSSSDSDSSSSEDVDLVTEVTPPTKKGRAKERMSTASSKKDAAAAAQPYKVGRCHALPQTASGMRVSLGSDRL